MQECASDGGGAAPADLKCNGNQLLGSLASSAAQRGRSLRRPLQQSADRVRLVGICSGSCCRAA